jgi:hypothetical protein
MIIRQTTKKTMKSCSKLTNIGQKSKISEIIIIFRGWFRTGLEHPKKPSRGTVPLTYGYVQIWKLANVSQQFYNAVNIRIILSTYINASWEGKNL